MAGNANSGRRPKPTAMKLVTGTFKEAKDKPGTEPVAPPLESIEPPDHLSEAAAQQWRLTAPLLADMRVLTAADLVTFAVYCETAAAWIDAKEKVAGSGTLLKDNNRIYLNPLIKHSRTLAADLLKLAGEFGMTPVARARLRINDAAPPPAFNENSDADVADQLFGS